MAVVFRRGPSKEVLLAVWHTDSDEFEEGQWLKARIYERRCDLSPDGKLLIYFAASHKQPYYSWTAISQPPFLTALALWPKGDCWGGGGLFETKRRILLNHRANEMQLAEGFALPRGFQVNPLGRGSGRGEDDPIVNQRLARDGWRFVQDGEAKQHGTRSSIWIEYKPAIVWSKPNTPKHNRYELEMRICGINQRNGPWYVVEHVVRDKSNGSMIDLGRADWADWCHSGDLLFALDGQLFRLGLSRSGALKKLSDAKLVIDLRDRKFKEVAPPSPYRL
ncbi:MAG TPA: hypothetical protein VGW58_14165 [Pyrinomonadaceae bacterium]|nr:hypothetical protein [Pyrinomonadaceae bacterium]